MPWSSMAQVPASLRGSGLTLAQANDWARYYDEAGKNAGIAWKRFKRKYRKEGDHWVRRK